MQAEHRTVLAVARRGVDEQQLPAAPGRGEVQPGERGARRTRREAALEEPRVRRVHLRDLAVERAPGDQGACCLRLEHLRHAGIVADAGGPPATLGGQGSDPVHAGTGRRRGVPVESCSWAWPSHLGVAALGAILGLRNGRQEDEAAAA